MDLFYLFDMVWQLEKFNMVNVDTLPIETICATYQTNTIFHLFANYPQVIKALVKRVEEIVRLEIEDLKSFGNSNINNSKAYR